MKNGKQPYRDLQKNRFKIYKDAKEISFTLEEQGEAKEFEVPFAIITASNPMNETLDHDENIQLNILLESEINALSFTYCKSVGSYKKHSEESFLIYRITKDEALRLGIRYNQYSIFYNDTKTLSYIECGSEKILVKEEIH